MCFSLNSNLIPYTRSTCKMLILACSVKHMELGGFCYLVYRQKKMQHIISVSVEIRIIWLYTSFLLAWTVIGSLPKPPSSNSNTGIFHTLTLKPQCALNKLNVIQRQPVKINSTSDCFFCSAFLFQLNIFGLICAFESCLSFH